MWRVSHAPAVGSAQSVSKDLLGSTVGTSLDWNLTQGDLSVVCKVDDAPQWSAHFQERSGRLSLKDSEGLPGTVSGALSAAKWIAAQLAQGPSPEVSSAPVARTSRQP